MLAQVHASAATVMVNQHRAIWVTVIVTAIAAILGLLFAGLVGGGITRPVRLLLQGTRDVEVEASSIDPSTSITRDEIGQLTAAFKSPWIVPIASEGRDAADVRPLHRPRSGRRPSSINPRRPPKVNRIMTVMFCDMKGFTGLSEGMTPQGLVKVMNRYLSTMSEPIRAQQGIIDKYIGDAIMAYWGPPFTDEADAARLACHAAIDMMDRIGGLRKELPELLGVRRIPTECDLRIGIATGEALVGSIGSEFMMSFTVMGDTDELGLGSWSPPTSSTVPDAWFRRRRFRPQTRRSRRVKSTAWSWRARPGRRSCSRSWDERASCRQSKSHCARTIPMGSPHIARATGMRPRAPLRRRWRRRPAMDLAWSSSPAPRGCATIRPPPIGMVRGISIRKARRPDLVRSVGRNGFASQPRSYCRVGKLRSHKAVARLTVVVCVAVRDPRFGRVVVRDVGNPGIRLGDLKR